MPKMYIIAGCNVQTGGHDIPTQTILRRYSAGLINLRNLYIPVCDYWMIIDNSCYPSELIAKGINYQDVNIYNNEIYQQIISYESRR